MKHWQLQLKRIPLLGRLFWWFITEADMKPKVKPQPEIKADPFLDEVAVQHNVGVDAAVPGKDQTVVCVLTHKPTGVQIQILNTVFHLMPDHKRNGAIKILKDKVNQVTLLKKRKQKR